MLLSNTYALYKKLMSHKLMYNHLRFRAEEELLKRVEMLHHARQGHPAADRPTRLQAACWIHFSIVYTSQPCEGQSITAV
jgi:hypothetical protein